MDAPSIALAGAITGLVVSYLTIRFERERLHAEFKTERSVEAALTAFLGLPQHPYRSFPMIQHHIGEFEENELRQHLVRAEAVRFAAADGTEMWAPLQRVESEFQEGRWKLRAAPKRPPNESLFPGAFTDSADK